jgi:hypothetical protein
MRSAIPLSVEAHDMPKHPSDSVTVISTKIPKIKNENQKNQEKIKNEKNEKNKKNEKNEKNNGIVEIEETGIGKKRKNIDNNDNHGDDNKHNIDNHDVNSEKELVSEEVKEMDYCNMINRVLPDNIRVYI